MIGAQAEPYYEMDRDKKSHGKDVKIKNVKCNNINVNVNGLELDIFPPFLGGDVADETAEGTSDASSFADNGDASKINNFRFFCINNNNNIVIGGEEPIPPGPPITSLTVNKEIFGCDDISGEPLERMDCQELQNDSPEWISCDDSAISNTVFCQELTENLFDIEVLDDQNNQIAQFEGSAEGEIIENLEPV